MHGDEQRVVAAYAGWLESNGWTVQREVDFADVYAERGQERLYAEAKGRTAGDEETVHPVADCRSVLRSSFRTTSGFLIVGRCQLRGDAAGPPRR